MPDEHQDGHAGPIDRAIDVFVYLPVGFLLELPSAVPRCIARGRDELEAVLGGADAPRRPSRAGLDRLLADARGAVRGLSRTGQGAGPAPIVDEAPTPAVPERAVQARPATRDASGLAIPDYESLSASQVVKRLEGLAGDELEAVRDYEEATRGRRTILGKISQLQAG